MRKQLLPPITSSQDNDFFDQIMAAKTSDISILTLNQTDIKASYLSYQGASLSAIPPKGYSGQLRESLIKCYDNPTQPLEKLKLLIKLSRAEIDLQKCPYCQIQQPAQYDHFLPKSVYCEFSVLGKNLVYACQSCNTDKTSSCHGSRRIIHPYFDDIPMAQFLFCRIDNKGVEIDFYLENKSMIPNDLFHILKSHFKELNLRERYICEAASKLGDAKGAWRKKLERVRSIEVAAGEIQNDLTEKISSQTTRYGQNYFEVVYMIELQTKIKSILTNL